MPRRPRPLRLGTDPAHGYTDKHLRHHARLDGFDLHAAVTIGAHDRRGREQLLRYCARPPLSHDRLRTLDDGRLLLTLKTPWFDGTTHLVLQPEELLQRLVALIPRPHKNLIVYQGVLAPNARWRKRVVAYRDGEADAAGRLATAPEHVSAAAARRAEPKRPNSEWARLMRRAFDLDVLCCPRCGGRMRVMALVNSPTAAAKILRHLGLRDHAPPVAPPRPGELDFHAA